MTIALGTMVGLLGYGSWRFEPIAERGTLMFTKDIIVFLAGAVVAEGLLILTALA